mmetsp:Transcript_80834/g.237592  ORF Transcript_80834/g.237592 Transcript_80834/m.237592 type:complete len:469 (+) Transcript_80834:36-1442(+)
MFTSGKGQGRSGAAPHSQSLYKPEYTTLNKDGKPVWEPGLPAEVTSRRVHKPAKKEAPEEAAVQCDLRNTLKLPPPARAEWLDKALRAVPHGRAKVQDVFNVVTHPKFVLGLPEQLGRKMLRRVAESLDAFSEKQRTTLVAKCKLAELFAASGTGVDGEDDDADEDPQQRAELPVEEPPPLPPPLPPRAGRSWSRSRKHRSPGSPRRSRSRRRDRSRSARRTFKEHTSRSHTSPSRDANDKAHSTSSGPGPSAGAVEQAVTAAAVQKELDPEERARLERSLLEQQRQREEERRKLEADRKAFEEREKQRKAKLGSAFLVGNEDEEEDPSFSLPSASLLVRKGQPERPRVEELPYSDVQPMQMRPRQPVGGGQDVRFVEAMGGDKILAEAHAILQKATESGRVAALTSESPPAKRRKKSRSRSRQSPHVRSSGSYRSPTPDGRARGQARAARKAKMIACLLGMEKQKPR